MSSNGNGYFYQQKPLPKKLTYIGLGALAVGALLAILAFAVDPLRAAFNMNIVFMFILSIGMGSLFLVGLEYLAGAVWSVPFRRIAEIFSLLLLVAPLLAIPVLLNMHGLFHWSHHEAVAADPILTNKSPYLNPTFFIIRTIGAFVIFGAFFMMFFRRSLKQDKTGDSKLTWRNSITSAVMMPLFAVAITIMAIDYIMSLEPHWFSTIFGIYIFAGSLLTGLAVMALASIKLNEKGYLPKAIGKDHYYNFGALIFAFTNFWAYIAFSQFLLIWYANLPEENFWYLMRMEHGWQFVSIALIIIHFAVPYVLLVAQPSKSNPKTLKFIGFWMLFAHYFNLYWLIMPTYSHTAKNESVAFGWIELAFPILAAGITLTVFALGARKRNLIPVGDPKLMRGLQFHL